MPLVNQAISDIFILRDDADAALTGKVAADFSVLEAYALPSGSPTATVSLTEIGGGEYAVTFTPTVAATWVGHVVYDDGTIFREFSQTYEVTTTASVTATSATGGLVHTRKELRRFLADDFGDLVIMTATSASENDQSFIDALTINSGVEHATGRELLFTGGTASNLGLVRRVINTTDSANRLTFTPAANAVPQTGDEIEVVNERDRKSVV